MECILTTIVLAMTLYSDLPQDIAVEDCGETTRYTLVESRGQTEVELINYDRLTGLYYYKLKAIK